MDTKEKLKQCFENLGFSKTFPSNLHINPSTNFIWQQFISKVKPKSEVAVYRKNIIINRNDKNRKNTDEYPVPEIEVYEKLNKLKHEVAEAKERLLEKQNKHITFRKNNKSNYLLINSMRERNEEKRIKIHAMKLKSDQYKNEILQIQEMLSKREISAISFENSDSSIVIYERLHQIVNRMESHSLMAQPSDSFQVDNFSSKKTRCSRRSSVACFSTVKKSQRKTYDLHRFVSCNNVPAARALFPEVSEKTNKSVRSEDESFSDISEELLPESCFNFDSDDEFLLSSRKTHKQKNVKSDWMLTPRQNSIFESDTNIYQQSYLSEKHKQKRDFSTQVLSNNNINVKIEEIITTANREMIWDAVCSLLSNIKSELEENMAKICFRNGEICNDDLLSLNFKYIKNTLLYLKSKKQIKILKNSIKEKKTEIKTRIDILDDSSNHMLELQIDSIKTDADIQFLHKEIYNNNNEVNDHLTTLKTVKTKIDRVKNDMLTKIDEIGEYIKVKKSLMQKMKKCQEDTSVCVKGLKKFLFDPSWADILSENMNTKEIEMFQNYPMDFIKHFCFVDGDTFYGDSMKNVTLDIMTPNDIVHEVTSILSSPYNPPEKIIQEILQKIHKLEVLSSLEYPNFTIPEEEYSLQHLKEMEIYIDTFCNSSNIMIHSNKVRQILNSPTYLRSNFDLWLDMPFRRFISKERLVDDKNYIAYEEELKYIERNK